MLRLGLNSHTPRANPCLLTLCHVAWTFVLGMAIYNKVHKVEDAKGTKVQAEFTLVHVLQNGLMFGFFERLKFHPVIYLGEGQGTANAFDIERIRHLIETPVHPFAIRPF